MKLEKPRVTTILLTALAIIGWVWAFSLRESSTTDAEHATGHADRRIPPRAGSRRSTTSGESLGGMMSTTRSALLLSRFEEIHSAARSGEVNDKLLDACRNTLLDADADRRFRDLSLLLEIMRPIDAGAMHEAFVELHQDGRGFGPEYAAFAKRWGEIDAVGAIDYLTADGADDVPRYDFANLIRGWARRDPGAAVRWLEEHSEMVGRKGGWDALIDGWMRESPGAATDYLLNRDLPPGQMIEGIRLGGVGKLFDAGSEEATRWIASLPENGAHGAGASAAWDATSYQYSALPSDTAARIWGEVGGKAWMRFDQFERFTRKIGNANGNDGGVEGFLENLAQTWSPDQASEQFTRWHQRDPQVISAWLANAPDTPYFDEIRRRVGSAGANPVIEIEESR